jgi:nicotinamide mononucleotide transporter
MMLEGLLRQLLETSAAEFVSVATGIVYVLLVVRQSRWCWVFGAVSSGILVVLAAEARLPMQAALQGAYVLMAIYGFWRWSRTSRSAGAAGSASRIVAWPARKHLVSCAAIAVVALLLGPQVSAFTGSAWPRLDLAVMAGGLLTTWMVARLLLENWLYWIVIDAVSIFLYAAQGLAFVAMLYGAYLVISVSGYFSWRARMRLQRSE